VFNGGVDDVTKFLMLAHLKAWSWARFRYKWDKMFIFRLVFVPIECLLNS